LSDFREIDRETGYLPPPSLDEWLPERHLARFIVEGIEGLDQSPMSRSYRGAGSASYHPALLLGILVYGYATGVFSSLKLERARYDSAAFRFIAANDHPDHDTIATFRRRFLKEIEGLFVQVLELAREMGMLRMGTVALDGAKIDANASRDTARCRMSAPARSRGN
jgi:transposase